MFSEDNVTPFEEIEPNVHSDDTYTLTNASRFDVAEDMLETVRNNATSAIYVDDKDELNDRYAEAISTALALRGRVDAIIDHITTTYRTRQQV